MSKVKPVRKLMVWALYPLTIVAVFIAFVVLQLCTSMVVSAYVAVVLGALVISIAEWLMPVRGQWHPSMFDAGNDVTYMVVGQIALERLLTLGSLFVVAWLAGAATWSFPGWWPYQWPLWVQAVVVLVLGDFVRYWLHRAFHYVSWMWRLHAVHHSPQRLYWLNVGRFHPFEQAMQFVVDALPFIILGVGEEVLSIYFVFYAVNGFFQHSNCDVRLGLLNWVIAGPELHRWHHSLIPEESNNNFGNNLIVWDNCFGTRYFPRDQEVGELGIPVPGYPMSWLKQMIAPFDTRISMS